VTTTRRPGPLLLVGALVAVAVLMAALAGPWQIGHRNMSDMDARFTIPAVDRTPEPRSTETPVQASLTEERWLILVLLTALGLLVVLLLAYVIRKLAQKLRERQVARQMDAAAPDFALEGDVVDLATAAMRAGAHDAAQVLEQEVPPGDAVIAAWVALEASAERSGIHRDRAQTATEFTLEVLASTHADAEATRTLLDLYLAARYSEHRLTRTDVDRAKDSLATIAQGLGS